MGLDLAMASAILKHLYGEHREYPACAFCNAITMRALKSRLMAKHRSHNV